MMKDKLSCSVVQDLLPTYVEHLTCEETNEAIRAHLAACESCQKKYEAMTAPEPKSEITAEEQREMDYFGHANKKLRDSSGIAGFCILAAAIAIFVALIFFLRIYVFGTPAQAYDLDWRVRDVNGYMLVEVLPRDRSKEFVDWKRDESEPGVLRMTGRFVEKSPFVQGKAWGYGTSAESYNEVYIADTLVWADRLAISEESRRLYAAVTDEMPRIMGITSALHLEEIVGMHDDETVLTPESYGWILNFDGFTPGGSGLDAQGAAQMRVHMNSMAVQMMAAVEKLDYVSWTYTDESAMLHTETVTREEAGERVAQLVEKYNEIYATDWTAKDSLKDYAQSPATLEQLRRILDVGY